MNDAEMSPRPTTEDYDDGSNYGGSGWGSLKADLITLLHYNWRDKEADYYKMLTEHDADKALINETHIFPVMQRLNVWATGLVNAYASEPYTVFYAELQGTGEGLSEYGSYAHGEMPVHQVAEYRYRNAHRACKWTDLPEAVRKAVKRDI